MRPDSARGVVNQDHLGSHLFSQGVDKSQYLVQPMDNIISIANLVYYPSFIFDGNGLANLHLRHVPILEKGSWNKG